MEAIEKFKMFTLAVSAIVDGSEDVLFYIYFQMIGSKFNPCNILIH